METYYFDDKNNTTSESKATFKLTFYNKKKVSKSLFKRQGRRVRQANTGPSDVDKFKACFGILNKSFFSVSDIEETDMIMILEIKKNRGWGFCGFVMVDFKSSLDEDSDSDEEEDSDSDEEEDSDSDEDTSSEESSSEESSSEETSSEESSSSESSAASKSQSSTASSMPSLESINRDKVLYVNAICANTAVTRGEYEGKKLRVGNLLMTQAEWYARYNGFDKMQLSALGYVINYYRKFGFRHINSCDKQETAKMKSLAKKYENVRYSSDEDLINAFTIEAAKRYVRLGTKTEKLDYLMSNLNDYFTGQSIVFRVEGDKVVAYDEKENGKDTKNEKITNMINKDQPYIFEFLEHLRQEGHAVACTDEEDRRGKKIRPKRDSDGDLAFECDDEGYNMVKCLTKAAYPPPPISTDPHYDGTGKKKMDGGKSRNRRTRKKSKKGGPAKGWAKKAPHGKERTIMLKKCGKKCFLGPKKSFPICNKGTCKVNSKGIYAAYMRAEEWGNARKTYKTSKPRHARKTYKKIASKAKNMLRKRGYKNVGKHSRKNKRN